jgi:hypothetical protein
MNYELIAAAVYLCSIIVSVYYFIKMDVMDRKFYVPMCFVPVLNTLWALMFGAHSLYWWFRHRHIEVKYYLIKKFNTWIIIRFSKIQKDIIRFHGVEKYKQVMLKELDRLNEEI